MPRRVQTPDGKIHEFPDDATDAEISSALNQSAPSVSVGARAAALLPTAGGLIGSLAGGTPGAVLGGAAGAGYEQLLTHLTELPGAVTDVARNLVTQPTATLEGFRQGAAEGATSAGIQGGIQGLANVAGNVIGYGASKLAPALMQSAVKPGLKSSLAAVRRGSELPVVKTLLDEGVNVSPGGIEKLSRIIGSSNAEIKAAIDSLPDARVLPTAAAARADPLAAKFAQQVDADADLGAIRGVQDRFLARQSTPAQVGTKDVPSGLFGPRGETLTKTIPVMGAVEKPLPLGEAQALKTGTYAQLKSKAYGELKGAEIEAQKAIARGLKEDIAAEAGNAGLDITKANLREGAALDAREAVARRVAMAGNRDPAGLAWLAHNPTTGLLFLMERSPAVKSAVALGLYKSAAVAARTTPEVIRTLVGAIAAGNVEPTQEP